MSIHGSLKTKPAGLNAHRNVLTRAERITQLMDKEVFKKGQSSPLGLIKVGNRMVAASKKKKAEEGAEGAAAAPGAAPAGAAAAKPAAGAAKAPAAKPAGKK